jgi:hypothetical protein
MIEYKLNLLFNNLLKILIEKKLNNNKVYKFKKIKLKLNIFIHY